ncbi:hypothetical protein EV421DRAFT_1910162 [Armillaria borealis]|uniref:C2H2-type domain-containing protein n=1 Tax=Armillaria borealis TaxID=47425 RepID=A0AA39J1W7_9AGAR|nr:hypothetical protein EV421DRAFT_1910162 [Armillaria borealis]
MKPSQTSVPKPFICSECERGFGRDPELERHKKFHLVEDARKAVIFQCPSYPICGVENFQKSNIVAHIKRKHPGLLPLVCFMCRRSLFVADDVVALLQHQQDARGIFQAPFESPPSPSPISSPSAVYSATSSASVMSYPLSTIERHRTSGSSSTRGHLPSSSLHDELHGLLLHGGPQEFQLAEITPSGPFTWHPSHTLDVPPLSTVYNALPQTFYAGRPDLYSPPPSLYGGSTDLSQGPSVGGNLLPQSIPTPPPALPTPPPSRPSTAGPSFQPHDPPTTLKWLVTSLPRPPTDRNGLRYHYARFNGDNVVSNRSDSEILPTP